LHVFLAILESKIPIIEDLLKNHQEQLNRIKLSIIAELTEKKHNKTKKSFVVSQEIHKSLALANELSEEFKIDYVSVEQYFLALIMNEEYDVLVNYFKKENIDVDEMQVQLIDLIVNSNTYELAEEENSSESVSPFNSSAIPNLQKYAINLNQLAFEGKFSKIHVDEKLINQISEVLCLKKKNNPILVGEAGVGKTALVEALACAIVQGKVCDFLAVKQIFSIDLTLLLAGTIYRGQFEDRLKGIINEATDNPNIILFIDEIHMIVGAGDRQGAMDVANILKPALSRGGITCIGATTPLEYNKYIVADAALSRRFREIKIEEPSKEKVKNLIRNVVKEFEDYHLFKCDPEMVDCLVDYADKYYSGRFPDKAFDLLDQVGSKVKIKQFQKTEKAIELAQKLRKNLTDKKIVSLDNLEKDDQQLLTELQIESAAIYKKAINSPRQVERKDILECVSDKTGIPLDFLNQNNFLKLENTKKVLNEEIIGQSEAISKLCEAMLRSQAGMTEANKPLCSFLFTGPVGVGKTLAAKELAKNMIGGESNIFVFDMSEYSDTNSASKLIGSAPGFIDSEKGGQLTSKVHRSPYSVIIFEDIHKAHVKIIDLLISILEEGYCIDRWRNR
jgi:ATP-dependent Clp protease ATP-binding subunit ClpC